MEDHYQQQPSSSTHVFAKPSPRVHGGKRMPVAVEKNLEKRQTTTAVTGNEHSDGGEEVQSPVAPTDTRDNNRKGSVGKRRKRASSRSSSSSSERSSSPLRSGSDGRKKTKERRSRSKRRSQPPSRSPTATRPRESPEKRGNPTPTRPQHPPTRPQHPQKRHAVTKGLNNDLFESMRHKMPESASRAASLVSEISSVSTSKRRSPAPFVLGDFVPKHLQGKEVCTKTICAIQTLRNVKRRDRIETPLGGQNQEQQQQQPPLPPNYPFFDHYSYLFSGEEKSFVPQKINIEVATHYETVKTPSMTINKRFKRINERINAGTRRSVHCSHHNPIRKSKLNCDSTTFKTERYTKVTKSRFKAILHTLLHQYARTTPRCVFSAIKRCNLISCKSIQIIFTRFTQPILSKTDNSWMEF
ncbi:hypothetical protein J6590_101532 [Homalodisca vitripennis]|nr:hypothetical protein J6590_101532 [Homalodisca vitripennis]